MIVIEDVPCLKDVKLVNLTPHPIHVETPKGEVIEIPPSNEVVRVWMDQKLTKYVNGIPVRKVVYRRVAAVVNGEQRPLPPKKPNTIYVVSSIVLLAMRELGVERDDFVAPDTGETAIRDKDGRIRAVRGFQVF